MSLPRNFLPKRRNVWVRQVGDELLIFDGETKKAHCLNRVAAKVWCLCDGTRTVAEIAKELRRLGESLDEGYIEMALRQFSKSRLLLQPFVADGNDLSLSRRAMIRKMGVSAALALPAVTSMVIPAPAAAASCLPNGSICLSNSACCSSHCNRVGRCTANG